VDIYPGIEIEGRSFSLSSDDYLDTAAAVRYAADRGLYLVSAAAAAVRREVLYNVPEWDLSDGHQRLGTLFGFRPLSKTLVQVYVGGLNDLAGDDLAAHVSLATDLARCNSLSSSDPGPSDFISRSLGSGRSFYISSDAAEAGSRPSTVYVPGNTVRVPLARAADHFLTRAVFQASSERYCRFLSSGACEDLVFWFPLVEALVRRRDGDSIEFVPGALADYDPRWKTHNVYAFECFQLGGWACGVDSPDAFSRDGSKDTN